MRVGFDLDGVLCGINVGVLRIIDNIQRGDVKRSSEEWYYRERKPLLNPHFFLSEKDEMFIITSRSERLSHITKTWVRHFFGNRVTEKRLIIVSHETKKLGNSKMQVNKWLREMGEKKAKTINKLELDVYFEDSPETVQVLRKLCPNTKIIHYGGRL